MISAQKILILITLGFLPYLGFSQKKFKIKGIVKHNQTKLPLFGVNLIITENGIGTSTDSSGFYEMTLPTGSCL
jgi:hypothetical protein